MIKKIVVDNAGIFVSGRRFLGAARRKIRRRKTKQVRTDPPTVAAQTTQTDLSGTYAGTFNCERSV